MRSYGGVPRKYPEEEAREKREKGDNAYGGTKKKITCDILLLHSRYSLGSQRCLMI